MRANRVGRIIGYLVASLLPCLVVLFYSLNGILGLVDGLFLWLFCGFAIFPIFVFVSVVLIVERKFGYLSCVLSSVVAGVIAGGVIDGEFRRPLIRMDLMFTWNLARYEAVVLLAEKGLLTPDPGAGTSYINPERSYQLPDGYRDLADSHRVQITDTDLGRIVAFYDCGIALSRCGATVYSSNPGMPLPEGFDWPLCRVAANGAFKNWSVCIEY